MKSFTSSFVVSAFLLFTLAACSGNGFSSPDAPSKGAAAAGQDDPPPRTDIPAQTGATPIPSGSHPIDSSKVAKIFLTITAPGPSAIDLEIDLDQTNKSYTGKFTEIILGTNAGGCTVSGAAADFSQVSLALSSVQAGSPTTSLQNLADATLKVVLLDGSTMNFQLSLTDLDPIAVTSSIPLAQANQLIEYIDQLQVDTPSCNIP